MNFDLKNREWKEFLIGDIFNIGTGALLPKKVLKKGDTARITATDLNNGVFDYYTEIKHKNYRTVTNFISVSFLGSVFYHPYEASLDMKIHSIQLKNKEFNKYLAHFIVLTLKRTTSVFYYGNQLSSSNLPKKKIFLPINKKGELDFEFMEAFMREKEEEKLENYKKYIHKRVKSIKKYKSVKPIEEKEWSAFFLKDIFTEIQRGKRLKKADHKKGKMPYISSTASNNGIDGYIGNKENIRQFSNCLTIANSGSVGACFYQPFQFVASDHVTKLKNNELNKYTYKFISTIVKRLDIKYSFNREINDIRIKKEKILLPINDKNEPDYEYMENYIKQLEYKKLSEYLALKSS